MAKKIRYAVVGLGWIAQESVLPAFKNAKDNSELAALITDDPEKAEELKKEYNGPQIVHRNDYQKMLRSGVVDAVYIALPTNLHRDFTVQAAEAGVHVLCEKPMAGNARECEEMIAACVKHNVKLMIAYRLHFETGNLKAIEIVNSGEIGEPRIFQSTFSQQVPEGNIRLKKSLAGGPLMDLGVYCINAARYLFRSDPEQVTAFGGNNGDQRFREVHEMASAIVRFPGDRLASYTCSLGAASTDSYTVIGTKGELRAHPGYSYHEEITLTVTVDKKKTEYRFPKNDQFGAELGYFSQCIQQNKDPEPNGQEGLADLRVIDAILESIKNEKPVKLAPFEKRQRPDESQRIELPPVIAEEIVHAGSPKH